jgi:hypothetical protein
MDRKDMNALRKHLKGLYPDASFSLKTATWGPKRVRVEVDPFFYPMKVQLETAIDTYFTEQARQAEIRYCQSQIAGLEAKIAVLQGQPGASTSAG